MAGHVLAGLVTRSEASESERAWEAFVDWMAENQDRFSNTSYGSRFGYREGMDLYVIRSVVDRFLSEQFSSSRRIIKEWAAAKKIDSYQHGGKIRYDIPGKALEGGVRARVIKVLSGTVVQ